MSIWRKKDSIPKIDLHSHLIQGIDDGVKTIEDSMNVIRGFKELGYTKVITTPHIHPSYPNTPKEILEGLLRVQKEIENQSLEFEIEAAAEYFVDENFFEKIKSGEEILSFGDRYVLVESSFVNKPLYFETCLFELKSRGYQPILAHPERYQFLEGKLDWLLNLKEMEILFQVTISSFVGFYGTIPMEIAKKLNKRGLIDFLGSDAHNEGHMKYLKKGLERKEIDKLWKSSTLKNETLR